MEKVAIVGLGISGTGVLLAYDKLLTEHPFSIEIHVYDNPEHFGKGLPFSETHHQALNNSRSHQISFDYEQMEDFKNWLEQADRTYKNYVPRGWYGEYNVERTQQLIDKHEVKQHQTMVKKIEYLIEENQWKIIDENNENTIYDRVHLCCGVLPIDDSFSLKNASHYVHRPYPLTNIPKGIFSAKTAIVIGMGLTALDVIKYLLKETRLEKLYVFSRTGLFPTIRGKDDELDFQFLTDDKVKTSIDKNGGYFTFNEFESLLRKELERYDLSWDLIRHKLILKGIDGIRLSFDKADIIGKVQAISLQVSNIMTIGWEKMCEADRELYKNKYHKLIVNLRNPAPPISGEQLLDAVISGRLVILSDVSDITAIDNNEFAVAFENSERLNVEWVINATGMRLNTKSDLSEIPLIESLINQRVIQIDTAGGLSTNLETGNLISPRYGEMKTIHAHGMLLEGVVYQNNSTIKIQSFAETLLRRLYD